MSPPPHIPGLDGRAHFLFRLAHAHHEVDPGVALPEKVDDTLETLPKHVPPMWALHPAAPISVKNRRGLKVNRHPDLVGVIELLRNKRITLEMCPTTNLQTVIIPKLAQHPLYAFHRLGIPVTINTDDPSISNTTLTDEFVIANRRIGVPFSDLCQMTLNAAEAAFLPEPEKSRLIEGFKNWYDKSPAKY